MVQAFGRGLREILAATFKVRQASEKEQLLARVLEVSSTEEIRQTDLAPAWGTCAERQAF